MTVQAEFPPPFKALKTNMKSNVVLIGMAGSGKSTVGVILAKAIGMQFVDTDLLIQQKTGEKLQTTIDTKGLSSFLKTEEEVLLNLSLSNHVIATGGSAVLSDSAMEKLKTNSTVIFLDVEFKEIVKRVSNMSARGIVMEKDENFEDVFNKRLPLYRKYADITVEPKNLTLEETVNLIINAIK